MRTPDANTLEQLIRDAMTANDWATVTDLEPRLDATTPQREPVSMLSAALWYAEQGLRVFPLQPGRKLPYKGTRGFKDATSDLDEVRDLWMLYEGANLAIATGHLVDVIDIDGAEGVQSWARTNNMPEPLGVVSTPRPGGSHLYIPASGKGNRAKIFPGVDVRGIGGYAAVPPSYNMELRDTKGKITQYEGLYRWRRPLELP